MAPPATPEPPARFVHEHGHRRILAARLRRPSRLGNTGDVSDDAELRVAWTTAVGASPPDLAAFDDVVGRHREAHRRYHGVRHVTWVVRHVHELAAPSPSTDVDAIVAAAFFHDAVYDPGASDNEAQSAALAERVLAELGWAGRPVRHGGSARPGHRTSRRGRRRPRRPRPARRRPRRARQRAGRLPGVRHGGAHGVRPRRRGAVAQRARRRPARPARPATVCTPPRRPATGGKHAPAPT